MLQKQDIVLIIVLLIEHSFTDIGIYKMYGIVCIIVI